MGRCQEFASCDTMHLSLVIEELDMSATAMVHVRVDEHIKNQATKAAMREARNLGKARFAGAKALIDDLEEGAKR